MQHSYNPIEGFTDQYIIRKFHWLLTNGLSLEQAAQTIKNQTNHTFVTKYIDKYIKTQIAKRKS